MLKSLHRRHSSWQLCQGRGNLPALSNESSSINVCKPLLLFHCKRLHKSVDTFTSSAIHRFVTMWTNQSEYKFQCGCFIEANSEAKKKLKIQDRSSEILNVILCGKRWLDDKERLTFISCSANKSCFNGRALFRRQNWRFTKAQRQLGKHIHPSLP